MGKNKENANSIIGYSFFVTKFNCFCKSRC